MSTTIHEHTIEQEFVEWADRAMNTINTDCVWTAASCFLSNRYPEYRTTRTTGRLVRAFLKHRNGNPLTPTANARVAALEEVLLSLTKHVE